MDAGLDRSGTSSKEKRLHLANHQKDLMNAANHFCINRVSFLIYNTDVNVRYLKKVPVISKKTVFNGLDRSDPNPHGSALISVAESGSRCKN